MLYPVIDFIRYPINTMNSYASNYIPDYRNITTYPNEAQYHPNTSYVTNWICAFENMASCRDTIQSLFDRFNWSHAKNMDYAFYNCSNLTGSLERLPDLAFSLGGSFFNCRNITGNIPILGTNIRFFQATFSNCVNLTGSLPSYFPDTITNMQSAFSNCTNITGSIPNIPRYVQNLYSTFSGCKKLSSSNIYIFNDTIPYNSTFYGAASNFTLGCTNVMNIYVHANTDTYNAFYKAMGNSTYNASWGPAYLRTF